MKEFELFRPEFFCPQKSIEGCDKKEILLFKAFLMLYLFDTTFTGHSGRTGENQVKFSRDKLEVI